MRSLATFVLICSIAVLIAEVAFLNDLYPFEYEPILALVGWSGLAIAIAFNAALALMMYRGVSILTRGACATSRTQKVLLFTVAILTLWVVDSVFMETPISQRFVGLVGFQHPLSLSPAEDQDFAGFSLARSLDTRSERDRLMTMYKRIQINNVGMYRVHPIGATIDQYAARYNIDPALLFFLNYIDSFYGEAAAGPVPFFRAMTAETLRDLVQVHLPAWFVEWSVRRRFVEYSKLNKSVGDGPAFKLRYAVHKATLDVSMAPYALNTFSDVFLVLHEFPSEFPELSSDDEHNPVAAALRKSFFQLRDNAMVMPWERPYETPPYETAYYSSHRDALKGFARAAFYLTVLDFDFATRVQALLSRYQRDYYKKQLGSDRWDTIPEWQQVAMLAMVRDLFTPNVGHIAYNVYALPELNCTPIAFVAAEALKNPTVPGVDQTELWRPRDYTLLWAGAGYRLRVLNEVWELVKGAPIPGLGVDTSVEQARAIVAVNTP